MKKSVLLAITLATLLASCSTTRYVSQELKNAPLDSIPVLEPYTTVFWANSALQEEFSDSLTIIAHEQLLDVLETPSPLPTGKVLYMKDGEFYEEIGADVAELFAHCYGNRRKVAETAPLPTSLREFMTDNDLPYLAVIYQDGFSRSAGNYAIQIGAAVFEAIFTTIFSLGTYTAYSIPTKDMLTFRVLIADLYADRIAYFNRVETEHSPTERYNNTYYLQRAFGPYPRLNK